MVTVAVAVLVAVAVAVAVPVALDVAVLVAVTVPVLVDLADAVAVAEFLFFFIPSVFLQVLESAFPHSSLCNKEVLMGPSGNKKMKKDYKEIGFKKGRRGRAQSPGAPGHPLDLGFLGLEVRYLILIN